MSTEKSDGKTQTPEPVESSGWFGDVFISSKISGQLFPNYNREPREIHEKNPRIPRRPRSKKSVLQTQHALAAERKGQRREPDADDVGFVS